MIKSVLSGLLLAPMQCGQNEWFPPALTDCLHMWLFTTVFIGVCIWWHNNCSDKSSSKSFISLLSVRLSSTTIGRTSETVMETIMRRKKRQVFGGHTHTHTTHSCVSITSHWLTFISWKLSLALISALTLTFNLAFISDFRPHLCNRKRFSTIRFICLSPDSTHPPHLFPIPQSAHSTYTCCLSPVSVTCLPCLYLLQCTLSVVIQLHTHSLTVSEKILYVHWKSACVDFLHM